MQETILIASAKADLHKCTLSDSGGSYNIGFSDKISIIMTSH